MADSTILPGVRARLVAPDGTTTREFYRFFSALSVTASLPGRVDDLTVRVDDLDERVTVLEHGGGAVRTIMGLQSVKVVGPLEDGSVQLALAGDVISAPALSFYGALAEYGKGWQTFSGNFAALDNGDDTQSLDLADLADSGTGTALVKITRDAKGRISGTSAATTTDLAEGTNLYFTDTRADARITLQKAQPLGLATLDAAGKLDAGQLPALAITETFVVNTQAAMLALSAQEGDVAVRTDLSKSFILTAAPASTLANWQELLVPTAGVTSFKGRTGSVTPASGDYTPAQVGAEPSITAGTAAQYWRGDKSWRDLATDVRAAVLTGLSTATSAIVAATDTVLQALGKLQAQITDNLLPPGYIDGLKMVWVSGTALTVTSGSAYIPGASAVLSSPADIAKTGLSLSASTWYHVYLYDNAGAPDVEIVTTAPAAPYNGTARAKTGDTSRRYVGSVLTDASAAICKFAQIGESVMYETSIASAPFLVVSTGRATTVTNVACAGCVPLTARIGVLIMATINATADAAVGNSDMVGTLSGSNYLQYVGNGVQTTHLMPLDSSQRFSYVMTGTTSTGGFFARVAGYVMER